VWVHADSDMRSDLSGAISPDLGSHLEIYPGFTPSGRLFPNRIRETLLRRNRSCP
jgi:hypothetical protein